MPNILNSEWFTEICDVSGSAFSLALKNKRLHHEVTPFQTIDIYDTTQFGKLMAIDGFVMLTSRDNFFYHEMMTHTALFTHPNPKNIAIIGGGDCGTLREVSKHQGVESIKQIEIDERVTRLSEIHFPELCESNGDPRVEFLYEDGIKWMREAKPESLDLIIVDSTDPVGPAEGLFNEAFYNSCYQRLREGGILIQQGESPLIHMTLIKAVHKAIHAAGFSQTKIIPFPQPVYPTGFWSATLAGKNIDLDQFRYEDAKKSNLGYRYYSAALHRGALATPPFILEQL